MKKIIVVILLGANFLNASAQTKDGDEEKTSFFKKENLFTGGSVGAGFGQGTFSLGLGPYFGYSINKYVDVAASFNYNYVSQRDSFTSAKYRQSIFGPGAFIRVFPINGLFLQAQYEYNFIKLKAIYGVSGYPDDVFKLKVQSTLIGGGYCQGRQGAGGSYFYFSLLFDVSNNENSPYRDNFGRKNPIIRTGINIPLFQGGSKNRFSEN